MKKLDSSIRIAIEEIIDNHIAEPEVEDAIKENLMKVGIEPNLETTLAYLYGTCFRAAIDVFTAKYGTYPTVQDFNGLQELLARRSAEVRYTFLNRRLE